MAKKKIIVGNNEGSFEKIACGDEMTDGFGNIVGASVNGGIGVPISALSGQTFQLFDTPINIHEVSHVAPGGGGNTDLSLDLATASGQPLPSNAVRAILQVQVEAGHAFVTTGDKIINMWADSYPAAGDFTGIDVDNNFVTRTFLKTNQPVDVGDALTFTAITRSEGANNIGIRINFPANSQVYLIIHLVGYTILEAGSSFVGKTVIHHRERIHQSSVVLGPSANDDVGITMPIPNGQCNLPVGFSHAWLHHIMRAQNTSGTADAIATPQLGAYPTGGDFNLLVPSYFGRGRISEATENSSEVVTNTCPLAATAPHIGYRMAVNVNNQVHERETHMSGYFIDDNPASVSGLSYLPGNGHFLTSGTFGIGTTSITVDLDLVTLLAGTPLPARATKAIIRIQTFGAHNTATQDDTIDTHIDAYPASGNYTGFATVNNKASLQLINLNNGYSLSSGATPFVDLNLTDGTNHIGVEFVKTSEATGEYFIWIEGFLIDETTADTANSTKLKIDFNGDRVSSADTVNLTGTGVSSVTETSEGKVTVNILGPGSLDFYHSKLAGTQSSLAIDTTILVNTLIDEDNSNGKISQAAGIFTLQPGKYKLTGYIRIGDASGDGLSAGWWDETNNVTIGMTASETMTPLTVAATGMQTAIAYITVTSARSYRFRVGSVAVSPVLFASGTHVTIEQLPS